MRDLGANRNLLSVGVPASYRKVWMVCGRWLPDAVASPSLVRRRSRRDATLRNKPKGMVPFPSARQESVPTKVSVGVFGRTQNCAEMAAGVPGTAIQKTLKGLGPSNHMCTNVVSILPRCVTFSSGRRSVAYRNDSGELRLKVPVSRGTTTKCGCSISSDGTPRIRGGGQATSYS